VPGRENDLHGTRRVWRGNLFHERWRRDRRDGALRRRFLSQELADGAMRVVARTRGRSLRSGTTIAMFIVRRAGMASFMSRRDAARSATITDPGSRMMVENGRGGNGQ
jgi:hypothetical protein